MKIYRSLLGVLLMGLLSVAIASRGEADRRTFKSPDEAARALIDAVHEGTVSGVGQLLGPHASSVVSSGDPVADRAAQRRFLELAHESIAVERTDAGTAVLYVGRLEWPFPIPLTQRGNGWVFDTERGREEIINRRIGKNELTAIETLRAFIEAQEEYFARKPRGVAEFARRLVSSPGQKDGLFWPREPKEPISPLGPLVVEGYAAGYKTKAEAARAFHGYRFRILSHQGADAPGGALSYLDENQRLTRGFAFVAFPAQWGASGIMTFIVQRDGIIFESNLGPRTVALAEEMKQFNPGPGWAPVQTQE